MDLSEFISNCQNDDIELFCDEEINNAHAEFRRKLNGVNEAYRIKPVCFENFIYYLRNERWSDARVFRSGAIKEYLTLPNNRKFPKQNKDIQATERDSLRTRVNQSHDSEQRKGKKMETESSVSIIDHISEGNDTANQSKTPRDSDANQSKTPRDSDANQSKTLRDSDANQSKTPRDSDANQSKTPRDSDANQSKTPRDSDANETKVNEKGPIHSEQNVSQDNKDSRAEEKRPPHSDSKVDDRYENDDKPKAHTLESIIETNSIKDAMVDTEQDKNSKYTTEEDEKNNDTSTPKNQDPSPTTL